jgi:phosphatidylglycerophosphatase A
MIGIAMATAADKALGRTKDNPAISWDEIATTPIVFLLVPLRSWKIAMARFAVHRLFDIA